MAAAVTAIRKNKERQQRLAEEAAASAPGASDPKPEKDLTTYVSAAYGSITPHYPGVFLPIGSARLLPGQLKACKLYGTGLVTWSVASVIIFNFLAIAFEKEIDPYPCPDDPAEGPCLQQYRSTWVALDDICNWIFLCELILNYYGAGLRRFWTSGWNVFDFIVVFVGVLTLIRVPLGQFSKLKMLRAFRVFRLFKRIKSLNKIIVALLNAIPGVANAFMIMVIFMSIYAILAVDFFRNFGDGYEDFGGRNAYTTLQGNHVEGALQTNISAMTARGFYAGDEYYGTFTRALYTLFQVMTGESWSEAIARPLIFGFQSNSFLAAAFFVSFIILTQIVLMNVVVAVLLDKFASGPEEEIEEKVDLAELVKRMEEKETVKLYDQHKEEVLIAPPSPDAVKTVAAVPVTEVPTVKMPSSIAKLPTDKGDIDQVLQILKRMEARIAAIELHQGSASASTPAAIPGDTPTRLPAPSVSTSQVVVADGTLRA